STTVMPAGAMPAGAMPPAAGAESWRVGRATVPSGQPEPISAPPQSPHHAVPQHGTPPRGYPQPVAYPTGAPSRMSRMGAWIFGAGAVLVALTMVLGAIGFSAGWFDSDPPPEKPPVDAKPKFEVRQYAGQGLTVNVPAGWKRRDVKSYVQFHDPKDDNNWLRINVSNDGRNPDKILTAADRSFERGCCGLTDYQRVELRDATLAGHSGAELEYTASKARGGQKRRGIWRMIVVGNRNYQVYMSINADTFDTHKPVFDEAVRSMKLAG
ncbi:MAG: hypothetical protein ACRDT6_20895, partial [Micromonosporaceae bacterium]